MLIFYPCFLLPLTREWPTCEESMNTLYYSGFVSGQQVEIQSRCSSMLDSRVVNMLRFDPRFLLPRLRERSACRESMNAFYCYDFESGQHVAIQLMCCFILGSRVVNMLEVYPCFLLHWFREWSTCRDVIEYVLVLRIRDWSTC